MASPFKNISILTKRRGFCVCVLWECKIFMYYHICSSCCLLSPYRKKWYPFIVEKGEMPTGLESQSQKLKLKGMSMSEILWPW